MTLVVAAFDRDDEKRPIFGLTRSSARLAMSCEDSRFPILRFKADGTSLIKGADLDEPEEEDELCQVQHDWLHSRGSFGVGRARISSSGLYSPLCLLLALNLPPGLLNRLGESVSRNALAAAVQVAPAEPIECTEAGLSDLTSSFSDGGASSLLELTRPGEGNGLPSTSGAPAIAKPDGRLLWLVVVELLPPLLTLRCLSLSATCSRS